MTTITASQARSTLFPLIEAVNQDGGIVTITSKAGNAVLMSADEYAALEETRICCDHRQTPSAS